MLSIETWETRKAVLKQMLEDLSARLGRVGECDDCHADRVHVITDPDTTDQGDFDMCEQCARQNLTTVNKRITRMKQEIQS